MLLKTLVIMGVLLLAPAKTRASDGRDVLMSKGIMAMRGNYKHVSEELVTRLISEVKEIVAMDEYSWIDPAILLGLAINESDLRWWIVTGNKYLKDCGICQNHVPIFRETFDERKKLCSQLSKSTKLSFEYAAKELSYIRTKWCFHRYKEPFINPGEDYTSFNKRYFRYKMNNIRCVLNIYNQGPQYFSRIKDPKWYFRNNYWIRSYCFTVGLKLGKKPTYDCRKATSLGWVGGVFGVKLEEIRYGKTSQ